jgi:cell division protein FtsI (penicillin-binding protein 3)
MGPDTFTKYIHDYGFGARTDIELPAETRGLLAPIKRWSGSSIGSIAMGQEVGVTPIQLVTMVSTIANGGVYLPPHILMQRTDQAAGKLKASAFHPQMELPDPLPTGAHRVISTMTAAEMRKMMEGVVLFGTAKNAAQLNGYTSGGKTGTAQKIDVLTHRYSKTKYIASFVGIAPVNNPAISVAVIIDSPEGNHFGNLNAGPVFREVAQEVLEYLGVPHDTSVTAPADLAKAKIAPETEEAPAQDSGELDALFAEVNNLPADDPLRNAVNGQQPVPSSANEVVAAADVAPPSVPPAVVTKPPVRASSEAAPAEVHGSPPQVQTVDAKPAQVDTALQAGSPSPVVSHPAGHSVVVDAQHRIGVPSFVGQTLRSALESAQTAGLALQIVGSGIAREQVPAPGSLVPPGTEIVVRFSR